MFHDASVLLPALHNIFHTSMTQHSLFVLKVLLSTNQPFWSQQHHRCLADTKLCCLTAEHLCVKYLLLRVRVEVELPRVDYRYDTWTTSPLYLVLCAQHFNMLSCTQLTFGGFMVIIVNVFGAHSLNILSFSKFSRPGWKSLKNAPKSLSRSYLVLVKLIYCL